jgi:hypothetical protein
MCWKHYSRVKQKWVAEAEKERPFYLAEAIQVKKRLFSEAYEGKELSLANTIHDSECKLKGLFSDKSGEGGRDTPPLTINIQIVNS